MTHVPKKKHMTHVCSLSRIRVHLQIYLLRKNKYGHMEIYVSGSIKEN
jgi:hypothetical protein